MNQYLALEREKLLLPKLPAAQEGGARSWSYSCPCSSFQEQKHLLQWAPSMGGVAALLGRVATCLGSVRRRWQVQMRGGGAGRSDSEARRGVAPCVRVRECVASRGAATRQRQGRTGGEETGREWD